MTKLVEITCDGCGLDLSTTTNCVDYRLSLVVENIPPKGPAVTAMGVERPMESDAHFCNLSCLDRWRRLGTLPIDQISHLSNDQRLELMYSFCRGCGSLDTTCQCWNDE